MSTSNSQSETLEEKSAKELERENKRTRAEMDSTIDKLGERLAPRNLLDDLLGAFRGDKHASTGQQISGSVKEAGRSVSNIIQQHPGPALLFGAGAVWLALDQNRADENDQHHGPPQFGAARTSPQPSWQAEVPAWDDRYNWQNGHAGEDGDSWMKRAKQTISDLVSSDSENAPVSERMRNTAAKLMALSGHKRKEIHDRWNSLREHSGSFVDARTGQPYDKDYGAQWRNLAACDAIASDYESCADESYSDKAAECWDSVKASLNDASLSVKAKIRHLSEMISEYSAQTGRQVQAAAGSASDTAGSWADSTRQGLSSAGQSTRETAYATGRTISDGATAASQQIARGAQVTRDKTQEAMSEHPLAVGAACFGLGLLGGLLFPRTRYEDEWMGETSDELVDSSKELGEEMLDRGKQVAAETASAAMDEAERQGVTPAQLAEATRDSVGAVKDAVVEEADRQSTDTETVTDKMANVAKTAEETAKKEASKHAHAVEAQTK